MKKLTLCLLLLLLLCGCAAHREDPPAATSVPLPIQTAGDDLSEEKEPDIKMTEDLLYGVWQYDGLQQYLVFSDGSWQLYNDAGLYREGLLETAEDLSSVSLYLLDGTFFPSDDNVITFASDGSSVTGTDWDGDILLPSSLPDFPPSTADELGLTGVWKYDDYPIWIVICSGGGWTQYTTDPVNYSITYGSVLYRDPPMLFNTWSRFSLTVSLPAPDAQTAIDTDGFSLHRAAALWDE